MPPNGEFWWKSNKNNKGHGGVEFYTRGVGINSENYGFSLISPILL
jgi:hypothetical protein